MKRLTIYIGFCIFIIGRCYGDNIYPNLIKIWVNEKNSGLRVSLLFDKNIEYSFRNNTGFLEVRIKKILIDKTFPGSDFEVKSKCVSSLGLSRENDGNILIKTKMNENVDFNLVFFRDSKILILDFYLLDYLKNDDKEFLSGLKQQISGNNDEALKIYRKLISKDYKNPEMYYFIGLIRDTLGYIYQAKSNYQTALSSNIEFPDANAKLANVYQKLNQKEQSIVELKKFDQKKEEINKIALDSNIIKVIKDSRDLVAGDTLLFALEKSNDSTKSGTPEQSKISSEPRIVRSEPIQNTTRIYAILTNIVVVLVAVCCLVAVWLLIRKGNRKKKKKITLPKAKENKPLLKSDEKSDYSELNNEEFIQKKAQFSDFIKAYNNSKNTDNKKKSDEIKEKIHAQSDSIPSSNGSDEIEKLAKKYQVEKEKIELALKLIAKNDTESTKEKYLLLMKMLKENMSIEELAQKLRIPKGEINLIANLKHL